MSEGMLLDAGVWVKCVDVKGGRVLVRALEAPPNLAEIQPDAKPVEPSSQEGENRPKPERKPIDDFDLGFELPPK
jgi:membrane-bound serine protease (ClpP class)